MKKNVFQNKQLYYGGYQTLFITFLIAVLVVVNALASHFNYKLDLTEEKFYSLSDKSITLAKAIEDPIEIYVLEETGNENKDFQDILTKYEQANKHIKVIYKDPILYPQFAQSYLDASTTLEQKSIPNGSLIVENKTTGKHRVILANDLYNMSYSPYGGATVTSVAIEERVTSALDYVTSTIERQILYTTGHSEYDFPLALQGQLEKSNFNVSEINLLTTDLESSPYTTLAIYSPHIDFSESETTKILDFLEAGGHAIIFTDANTPMLPNFNRILNAYGLEAQTGVVVEGDQNHMLSPYPTFVLPEISDHELTTPIKESGVPIVLPVASSLKEAEHKRSSLTLTPLLSSSNNSWLKNLNAESIEKTSDDIAGPLHMAYAVTDTNGAQLIVVSNTLFLDSKQINLNATANLDFMLNSFNWLQDKESNMQMGPKAFNNYALPAMNATTLLLLSVLALVIMPLIVIVSGIYTWRKRRNL